jgi:molybdopterin-biosynthesis enzyme MoeA-like protein
MAIGLIIIGDEILSGRRTDAHFPKMVTLLSDRGLQLAWSECIGDDPSRITSTLKRTFATDDIVFCCGGIGATPDDHTRQCAANALGVPLVLHPDAKVLIQARITEIAHEGGHLPALDTPENRHRLKMGEFPDGAAIVPNPYNKIPGFSVRTGSHGVHYFLPGFPVMAGPMIEGVLDTCYAHLFHQTPWLEKSVLVFETAESALTPLMETIEADFSPVKIFSLPSVGNATIRRHIELGVKGEPSCTLAAFDKLLSGLDQLGVEYR